MDGEPEPTKPDDKPTLLCTEEWCVACGNCDFPESHKAQGLWDTPKVLCEGCHTPAELVVCPQCDVCTACSGYCACDEEECTECETMTAYPMSCSECGIDTVCADCWTGCEC
jgi:hypothetical protein